MTHADGDDYTFAHSRRAVLNPTLTEVAGGACMVLRADLAAGRYSLLDELSEMEPAQVGPAEPWEEWRQRTAALFDPAAGPDLRTLAEREHDDVAQLALRCDNLVDVVETVHRRLAALEGIVRAKVQIGQIDAGRLAQLEATVATLVKVLEVRLP